MSWLTPAQIRAAALPGVGPFGRAHVRRLLSAIADQLADLEAELNWARHTVRLREHEIEQRAWGIAEADPTLVFDEDRDNVWEDAWKHRTEHL